MQITILTIFPDYFKAAFATSIIGKALEKQKATIKIVDIRDYAADTHKTTDDRPFGGGAGMVMKIEPIDHALQAVTTSWPSQAQKYKKILTSAKGILFTQQKAIEYSQLDELVIVCGHYEGVDERVAEQLVDEEVRIGDFVLTGGEPAAAVIADSVVRLLPGVLGNQASLLDESHAQKNVGSYPQYTRPEVYKTWSVPPVLLSGNHDQIERWRNEHKTDLSV